MGSAAWTSTSSSSSSTHLLRHLFRHPKPPSVTNKCNPFRRPFCVSLNTHKPYLHPKPLPKPSLQSLPFFTSSPSSALKTSRSFSSFTAWSIPTESALHEEEEDEEQELVFDPLSARLEEEEEEEDGEGELEEDPLSGLPKEEDEEQVEIENENGDEFDKSLLNSLREPTNGDFDKGIEEEEGFLDGQQNVMGSFEVGLSDKNERAAKSLPNLTVKEKKELASYAHSLGKKLKCQLVGKSGVTDTVVSSFDETLEKNELLKIKVLRTCPSELEDVVGCLEKATGSVVISQIGRTVIVYRPSFTKLKAEEKRKQSQRHFIKRTPKFRPGSLRKDEGRRRTTTGRGR